jgi:hypothetical protein
MPSKDICFLCGETGIVGEDMQQIQMRCTCPNQHTVDRFVHTACIEVHTIQCPQCGLRVHRQDFTGHSRNIACQSCTEDDCEDCEHESDSQSVPVCQWCGRSTRRRQQSVIRDYSANPQFVLAKKPYEKYAFGIELEVECDGIDAPEGALATAKYLKKLGKRDYITMKHDGSLENGYEIVTQPRSRSELRATLDWHEFLKYLSKNHHNSYKSGRCGLHIHVSKVFTVRTLDKIGLTVWHLRELLAQFSQRRGKYRYCQFSLNMCAHKNTEKYYAIRMVTGQKTIEFRFPRGTLSFPRFLATIQCIDTLIQFAQQYQMSFLALDKRRSYDSESNILRSLRVQKEFLRFCKEQAYAQHFYKYIKDRPLVVRHPPEFSQELFIGLQEFYGIKPKKAKKKLSKKVPTGPVYAAVIPNPHWTIETSEDDE